MAHLQQIFPFNNALVRRFLNWKQGDEEDTWRTKAVETLLKKLRRQNDDQYQNLQAVLQRKTEDSPCITLSRSQDGRLQVSHKKMLPQVMYCRIFRWPDLQSHHELKSVSTCQFPAHRRDHNKICVNPYHYARVEHSVYPPVVTPARNPSATEAFADATPPPQSPLSPASNYSQHQPGSPIYLSPNGQNPNMPLQLTSMSAGASKYEPIDYGIASQHLQQHPQLNSNYFQQAQTLAEPSWYQGQNGLAPNVGIMSLADPTQIGSQQQFASQSPPPGYSSREHQQQLDHLMPMDSIADDSQATNTTLNGSDGGREPWVRITYAELNQKIGEPFKGSSSKVIVDGFTDPSVHNRFSLGVLSNINRNSVIELTRRAIRNGVCLENNNDSQIYVKNLSESSIFFHSKNCNVENQLNQHAVVKIEPQRSHKIFDQKVLEDLVQEAKRVQDDKTWERVYSLTEHCFIKMSFVKGWGSIYQRQDITSTPCWIEIHLLKPCALISQHLKTIRPPCSQITSTS